MYYLDTVVDTLLTSFARVLETPPASGPGQRSAGRQGLAATGLGLGSDRRGSNDGTHPHLNPHHPHLLLSHSNHDAASVKSSASSSSSAPSTTPPPTTPPPPPLTFSGKRSGTRARALGGSVLKGLGLGSGLSSFGFSPKHPKITHNDNDDEDGGDGDNGNDGGSIPSAPGSRLGPGAGLGSGLGFGSIHGGGASPWLGALYGLTAGMLAVVQSVQGLAQAQGLGQGQGLETATSASTGVSVDANVIIIALQCRLAELFVAATKEVGKKQSAASERARATQHTPSNPPSVIN